MIGSDLLALVSNFLALFVRAKLGYNVPGPKDEDKINIDFYKLALFIKNLTGFIYILFDLIYKIVFSKSIRKNEKKIRTLEILDEIHDIIVKKNKNDEELNEMNNNEELNETTFINDYFLFLVKYKHFSPEKIEELESLIKEC